MAIDPHARVCLYTFPAIPGETAGYCFQLPSLPFTIRASSLPALIHIELNPVLYHAYHFIHPLLPGVIGRRFLIDNFNNFILLYYTSFLHTLLRECISIV